MKIVKAFAWFVLVGAPLFLIFTYAREALLIDSCLDSGGSFDYLRMICDHEVSHAFVPYHQRHDTLTVAVFLIMFVAAVYLIISSGKARSE
jgi:hypothetical protein